MKRDDRPVVEYLGVSLSDRGAGECTGERHPPFVPRDNIREIRLESGWLAERPILQAIFGLLLISPAAHMARLVVEGAVRADALLAAPRIIVGFFVVLPILGTWALVGAGKRGPYLRVVQTDGGSRKLLLRGPVDSPSFKIFAARVRAELGYAIESRLK